MKTIWDDHYREEIRDLIRGAQKEIIVTSYKMEISRGKWKAPVNGLIAELIQAAHRGINVKIILNTGEIKGGVSRHNISTATKLSTTPIKIKTLPNSRVMHAKIVIIDCKIAVIGSHNWCPGSLVRNLELSIRVDDPQIASEVRDDLMRDWSGYQQIPA